MSHPSAIYSLAPWRTHVWLDRCSCGEKCPAEVFRVPFWLYLFQGLIVMSWLAWWVAFQKGAVGAMEAGWIACACLLACSITLARRLHWAEERAYQQVVQLAGCSAAALGWGKDCHSGQYGWSVAFEDVQKLRQDFDAMTNLLGWSPRK